MAELGDADSGWGGISAISRARPSSALLREDHATVYQFAMARPAELWAADASVLAKARLIRDRIAVSLGDADHLVQRAPCLAGAAR